jgi:DNA-binding NarL/FixJ family response regulator
VWLIDDQESFRQLLSDYLGTLPGVTVVGGGADGTGLLAAAGSRQIDVVLLDLMLEHDGGFAIMQELAGVPHAPSIVILSASSSEHAVFLAARLGARGFIEKNDPLTEIGAALERVRNGGVYFSHGPRTHLAQFALTVWTNLAQDAVNKREIDLLLGLIEGLPLKQVADSLNLSLWTAYKVRSGLMKKTGVDCPDKLLEYARKMGLEGASPIK